LDKQLLRLHSRRRVAESDQEVHRESEDIREENTELITVQFKLLPSQEQQEHLSRMSVEYIRRANELLSHYSCEQLEQPKLTTAKFVAELPSAVKNEVVNTVKSVIKKSNRGVCASLPVLRKPVVTWNNQNYKA